MRILCLLFLGLLLPGTASAQTPESSSEAPGVTVTQVSWRKEVYIPALYDDPMRANQERDDLERDQKTTSRQNEIRVQQGQPPLPTPTKKATNAPVGSTPILTPIGDDPAGNRNARPPTNPGSSSVNYLYEARIRNTGTKTIRAIVWEYSLVDPETNADVGRHQFINKVTIRGGKTTNLIGRSRMPPAGVVEITKGGSEARSKYSERALIMRIEYDDGTFWQRSQN